MHTTPPLYGEKVANFIEGDAARPVKEAPLGIVGQFPASRLLAVDDAAEPQPLNQPS